MLDAAVDTAAFRQQLATAGAAALTGLELDVFRVQLSWFIREDEGMRTSLNRMENGPGGLLKLAGC
jgi:hypothetical protein